MIYMCKHTVMCGERHYYNLACLEQVLVAVDIYLVRINYECEGGIVIVLVRLFVYLCHYAYQIRETEG